MTSIPIHVLLLTGALVLTAGCTDDSDAEAGPDLPPVQSFAEGTCRTAAEDIRTVGRLLPDLGQGPQVEPEVLEALRASQDGLRAVAEGAEPSVRPALDRLAVSVGLVRIRATGNTYEPFLGERAQTAYEEAVEACTDPDSPG
jgi:hypothetical protein